MNYVSDEMKYYVAYGMNLCARYMEPDTQEAKPIGAAVIKDYKLVFRTHANIEPCEGAEVPVGIWAITKAMEKRLDWREGYPEYYEKKYINIEVPGYGTINAMAYVMNPGREINPPDKLYESIIREGYKEWNLDMECLNRAISEAENVIM